MTVRLGRVTLLVRDIDSTIDFYTRAFDFRVLVDRVLKDGFRTVHIGPGELQDPGIWLMPTESEAAGQQTDGAPWLVLYTDDLARDLENLSALGVEPHSPVVSDPSSGNAHARVHDLWGNEIVLAQLG